MANFKLLIQDRRPKDDRLDVFARTVSRNGRTTSLNIYLVD